MKNISMPYIVAGLGNIGSEFDFTKHNIGFEVLNCLNNNRGWYEGGHQLHYVDKNLNALLIKPTVGMNNSGLAIKNASETLCKDISHIIIIYDDMDFKPGRIKISKSGGDGGHNGIKSIIKHIGSDFIKIRVGIGKPETKEDGAKFVLSNFLNKEKKLMSNSIQLAANATIYIIQNGIQAAMAKYNRKQ